MFAAAGDAPAIERADRWLVLGMPAPLALAVLLAAPLSRIIWRVRPV